MQPQSVAPPTYTDSRPILIVTDLISLAGATALRAGLEAFCLRTCLVICPTPEVMWRAVDGEFCDYGWIVWECHGYDQRLSLSIGDGETIVGPAEITGRLGLRNKYVLSNGCTTGHEELADAFLAAGCRAYIGPDTYIYGQVSLLFTLQLFHFLNRHSDEDWKRAELSLAQALEAAQGFEPDAGSYKLFQSATSPIHSGPRSCESSSRSRANVEA